MDGRDISFGTKNRADLFFNYFYSQVITRKSLLANIKINIIEDSFEGLDNRFAVSEGSLGASALRISPYQALLDEPHGINVATSSRRCQHSSELNEPIVE